MPILTWLTVEHHDAHQNLRWWRVGGTWEPLFPIGIFSALWDVMRLLSLYHLGVHCSARLRWHLPQAHSQKPRVPQEHQGRWEARSRARYSSAQMKSLVPKVRCEMQCTYRYASSVRIALGSYQSMTQNQCHHSVIRNSWQDCSDNLRTFENTNSHSSINQCKSFM